MKSCDSRSRTVLLVFILFFTAGYTTDGSTKVTKENIIFQFHSGHRVKTINKTIPNSRPINTAIPTIFIIHGWISDKNKPWIKSMTYFLLKKRSCNVIVIDWSVYSKNINYVEVSSQVKYVGDIIADFIININKGDTQNFRNIHLIGHSLGAHVAGFAGKKICNETTKKIGRITGLDAARPLFELRDENDRLNGDDAEHVDAIHTNGGVLGMLKSYGTADYFPNGGGHVQPGCLNDVCSHSRAPYLYIESIYSDNFLAIPCPTYIIYRLGFCNFRSKVLMGDNESQANFGNHYLSTNTESPFAKGKD